MPELQTPSPIATVRRQDASAHDEEVLPDAPMVLPSIEMHSATIETDEDITIEGRFLSGRIRVHKLVVSEGARVTGDILAEEVRIYGSVEGKVVARRFYAYRSSDVLGSVFAEEIGIQPRTHLGAKIETGDSAAVTARLAEGFGTADYRDDQVV